MRAFAVVLVVISHAGIAWVPGGSGVTMFFAISGFIITHLLLRERESSGGFRVFGFYLRRFMKLAPPFLVVVLIPTIIYSIFAPINWAHASSQVFFAYNWVRINVSEPDVLPGTGVVWSLAIEEQFYIAFAIVWLLMVRTAHYVRWLTIIASAVVVASITSRIWLVALGASSDRIYFGTDTRIDGIAIGVLAAIAYGNLRARHSSWEGFRRIIANPAVPFLAIGLYILTIVVRDEAFRDTIRYSLQAVAASILILYGLISQSGRVRKLFGAASSVRVIQVIGLASYSIYLVHYSLYQLLTPLLAGMSGLSRAGILIGAGILAGILVWKFVEKPVERYKKRLLHPRSRGPKSSTDDQVARDAAGASGQ